MKGKRQDRGQDGEERPGGLERVIRKLAQARKLRGSSSQPGVDLAPGCAFGAVMEQRLKDTERGLKELKARLNGLIFLVLGAVVVEVVMRLVR